MGVIVMRSARKSVMLPNDLSRSAIDEGGAAAVLSGRRDPTSLRLFTALCMVAASPATIAVAQQAAEPADELPPLVVEAPQKKKAAPAKKKAVQTSPVPQAPAPAPVAADVPAESVGEPGANPYANPDAPYKVERSGSSKLTEPLVDTPRTVTALPKEVIEDKGARNLRELARQVPGVSITAGEGGASLGSNFNIRGFNARNDVFVDGIRDPGNIGRDVFSVEQLEIYKGPSGTLSGRATPGGAFNFISKKPDLGGDFFEVTTTIGTDDLFRTTIDANQVVTPDFAARANIMYHDSEVAGRNFAEDERWGGLLSATARVTPGVTVTLDYFRYRLDGTPDNGVPVSRHHGVPFTELGVNRKNWYGDLDRDFINEESDVGTATVVAKLTDNVTLTSITRYGENLSDYVSSTPRPTVEPNLNDPNAILNNIRTAQRRQETELFAHQSNVAVEFDTGPFRHALIAGIDYSHERIDRFSYVGVNSTTSLFNPDPRRGGSVAGPNPLFTAEVETIGVYVGDTIHLSDQWIVHGSVRFDDFTRDQVGVTGAADPNTAKVDEGLFSWNAGIVYKPIPIASFYAAVATAESPIGNELDSVSAEYNGLNAANAHLPPEETRGIEVGTKWELFGGRMLATAAAFETIKDNARTDRANNVASLGEFRVRGIELGIAGNITDAWSVFGGAVFLDTEVLDSDDPQEIGRRLSNTPHTQFALLSKYQLTDQLSIGGQAIYQNELYAGHYAALLHPIGGPANPPNIGPTFYRTTSYWRFDAMAEYRFDDHWSVEVLGLNLTDELYYDAIYRAHDTWAYVAPGRAGYLTVKWQY